MNTETPMREEPGVAETTITATMAVEMARTIVVRDEEELEQDDKNQPTKKNIKKKNTMLGTQGKGKRRMNESLTAQRFAFD